MVRTDSKEQKLDAFLKPANQSSVSSSSSNQNNGSTSNKNEPVAANQKEDETGKEPMQTDQEAESNTSKRFGNFWRFNLPCKKLREGGGIYQGISCINFW